MHFTRHAWSRQEIKSRLKQETLTKKTQSQRKKAFLEKRKSSSEKYFRTKLYYHNEASDTYQKTQSQRNKAFSEKKISCSDKYLRTKLYYHKWQSNYFNAKWENMLKKNQVENNSPDIYISLHTLENLQQTNDTIISNYLEENQ